jgi:hypothetical protein
MRSKVGSLQYRDANEHIRIFKAIARPPAQPRDEIDHVKALTETIMGL